MKPRSQFMLAGAAVIGVVAFVAVYGISPPDGNAPQGVSCSGSAAVIARLEGLNTGQMAAFQIADEAVAVGDLEFEDDKGSRTGLAAHDGQTVLLNLWATWCVPCREEMPALAALQNAMGSESFTVLPVSVDNGSADKPKKFYAEHNLDAALPFRHDGTLTLFNELKKRSIAFGMPSTILVDGDGCAVGWMNGPADWSGEEARALVRAGLG